MHLQIPDDPKLLNRKKKHERRRQIKDLKFSREEQKDQAFL